MLVKSTVTMTEETSTQLTSLVKNKHENILQVWEQLIHFEVLVNW
jgi:hypothetical protein